MSPKAALRSGDWKIVRPGEDKPWQLDDLSADLAEEQDLASTQPDDLRGLVAQWEKLDATMAAPAR